MTFEMTLLLTVAAMACIAFWHSFVVRGFNDTVLLLITGVGFGYLFPVIVINGLGQYSFNGRLTILGVPAHLGFAWFGLYYMAMSLAEWLIGQKAAHWKVALIAGLLFGVLEAQWDMILLHRGVMSLHFPCFVDWPDGFLPTLPPSHACLGFAWVYGYRVFRGSSRNIRSACILLSILVMWPLTLSLGNFLFTSTYGLPPYGHLPIGWLMFFDVVPAAGTFVMVAILMAYVLRFVGRRVGATIQVSQ